MQKGQAFVMAVDKRHVVGVEEQPGMRRMGLERVGLLASGWREERGRSEMNSDMKNWEGIGKRWAVGGDDTFIYSGYCTRMYGMSVIARKGAVAGGWLRG